MGQQHLLLLVLGVAIAVVAFPRVVDAFERGTAERELDAAAEEAARVASALLAWKSQPYAFGGGAQVPSFSGVTLHDLGYDDRGAYDRTLHDMASNRPWIRVASAQAGARARADLILFGPSEACAVLRTWTRDEGGSWTHDGTRLDVVPPHCTETWSVVN